MGRSARIPEMAGAYATPARNTSVHDPAGHLARIAVRTSSAHRARSTRDSDAIDVS